MTFPIPKDPAGAPVWQNYLAGDDVQVETVREVVSEREISPSDGVRWLYLARA